MKVAWLWEATPQSLPGGRRNRGKQGTKVGDATQLAAARHGRHSLLVKVGTRYGFA